MTSLFPWNIDSLLDDYCLYEQLKWEVKHRSIIIFHCFPWIWVWDDGNVTHLSISGWLL